MNSDEILAPGAPPVWVRSLLSGADTAPLAVIRGQDGLVSVLTGTAHSVPTLGQIPLEGDEVVAAVPFHQIQERGFDAIDSGQPLTYLQVTARHDLPLAQVLPLLPQEQPQVEDLGFDLTDAQYAAQVRKVIEDEIGAGHGANFVLRRDYRARTATPVRQAALAWLRALLEQERGAFWTYAFLLGEVNLVGASPERHVSSSGGQVLMNPISGTFRHGSTVPTPADMLTFLADRKESEELVMVVDEELKMMSVACPDGGVMRGPYLKPMSKVTHTEYLLQGQSALDPRDILRLTMFAPTVIGSPMASACRVIAQYEDSGRGYYSGVLARFEPTPDGYSLDAPILIRTAQITVDGEVSVSAGATLVRHSDPEAEAKETHAKVAGVLSALGLGEAAANTSPQTPPTVGPEGSAPWVQDPQVQAALQDRNRHLAPFWRDEQQGEDQLTGTAIVVDCDDGFAAMLAHQLRRLGLTTRTVPWDELTGNEDVDLLLFAPGPGDPTDLGSLRVRRIRELMEQRLRASRGLAAVSFSHQVLAGLAGLPVESLDSPRQGQPLTIEFLGEPSLLGFYNTFAAFGADGSTTPNLGLQVHADRKTGEVHSLTGPAAVSVQGHPESVLSQDGYRALARMVRHCIPATDSKKE